MWSFTVKSDGPFYKSDQSGSLTVFRRLEVGFPAPLPPQARRLMGSPTQDMLGNWKMHAGEPGEKLFVGISVQHPEMGSCFTATLSAREVSPSRLGPALFFWMMPQKVALWIYWQVSGDLVSQSAFPGDLETWPPLSPAPAPPYFAGCQALVEKAVLRPASEVFESSVQGGRPVARWGAALSSHDGGRGAARRRPPSGQRGGGGRGHGPVVRVEGRRVALVLALVLAGYGWSRLASRYFPGILPCIMNDLLPRSECMQAGESTGASEGLAKGRRGGER